LNSSLAQREIVSQQVYSRLSQARQVRVANVSTASEHAILHKKYCDFVAALLEGGSSLFDEVRVARFKRVTGFDKYIVAHYSLPSVGLCLGLHRRKREFAAEWLTPRAFFGNIFGWRKKVWRERDGCAVTEE
jgi:hypothetical protein